MYMIQLLDRFDYVEEEKEENTLEGAITAIKNYVTSEGYGLDKVRLYERKEIEFNLSVTVK